MRSGVVRHSYEADQISGAVVLRFISVSQACNSAHHLQASLMCTTFKINNTTAVVRGVSLFMFVSQKYVQLLHDCAGPWRPLQSIQYLTRGSLWGLLLPFGIPGHYLHTVKAPLAAKLEKWRWAKP
jgi:hypothetical protein